MLLKALLSSIAVKAVHGQTEIEISGIQYDSRKIKKGEMFIAVRGEHADGHKFVSAVVQQGAAAVVVEEDQAIDQKIISSGACTVIVVAHSRDAMADLANAFYDFPSTRCTMIGITGTNGKTTATNIVRHFFSGSGTPAGLIGTIEYGFGDAMTPATHTTPESVDLCRMIDSMIAKGARAIAMEVSSHALALGRVRGFVFRAAVFTNLTQDHLDFHQTMEQYANAKAELFRMLAENAVAAINADDPYATLMANSTRAKVVRYGMSPECQVRAERILFRLNGTEFLLTVHGRQFNVVSPYLGMFNVYNLLAGIAVAAGLHISAEEIVRLVPTLPQVRGRLERIPLANGAVAVVDYAHTPDALQRAIETVRELAKNSSGRVITVFGCGGDRDITKRPVMGNIAATLSDEVIVTSDNPRTEEPNSIIENILEGISDRTTVRVNADRTEAIREALAASRRGDIVLIAGKGHETYQVVGTTKHPFDDAAIARGWAYSGTLQC